MECVTIPGAGVDLEGLLELPNGYDGWAGAVIGHPHPLHGGTMRNKVVARAAMALQSVGVASLRFNFRGVAGSSGRHGGGGPEEGDMAAAIGFLRERAMPRLLIVGGFSFGAWVALRLTRRRQDVDHVFALGLPTAAYRFDFMRGFPHALLLIQGDADELVDRTGLDEICRLSVRGCHSRTIPGADHFFTGRLGALADVLVTHYGDLSPTPAGD